VARIRVAAKWKQHPKFTARQILRSIGARFVPYDSLDAAGHPGVPAGRFNPVTPTTDFAFLLSLPPFVTDPRTSLSRNLSQVLATTALHIVRSEEVSGRKRHGRSAALQRSLWYREARDFYSVHTHMYPQH